MTCRRPLFRSDPSKFGTVYIKHRRTEKKSNTQVHFESTQVQSSGLEVVEEEVEVVKKMSESLEREIERLRKELEVAKCNTESAKTQLLVANQSKQTELRKRGEAEAKKVREEFEKTQKEKDEEFRRQQEAKDQEHQTELERVQKEKEDLEEKIRKENEDREKQPKTTDDLLATLTQSMQLLMARDYNRPQMTYTPHRASSPIRTDEEMEEKRVNLTCFRSPMIKKGDHYCVFNFTEERALKEFKQAKDKEVLMKRKLNEVVKLKMPMYSKKDHPNVITFLWDEIHPKFVGLALDNYEMATFLPQVFV